jgi:hypothetical protein
MDIPEAKSGAIWKEIERVQGRVSYKMINWCSVLSFSSFKPKAMVSEEKGRRQQMKLTG